MVRKNVTAFLLFFLIHSVSAHAYWVWSPESGKFVNPEGAVQDTADEQYEYAMNFYKENDLDEAAKQLETILKKYPDSRIAPEAQYRLGTIYEEKKDFLKAYDAYKKLVESYPQSERFNEVIEREFRIANLFLSGKKGKLMGFEILPSLAKAIAIFEHIVQNAPYSDYGDKAQFHLGLAHKQAGHFSEAVEAFQGVLEKYPQSDLVSTARFQLAEVSFQKSAAQFRDQRALDDAAQSVDRFLARYPDAEASEKAAKIRQVIDEKNAEKNYRTGLYYEKQNYIESALIYYHDVADRYPHTKWGEKASGRIQALEQPASYLSKKEEEIHLQIQAQEQQLTNFQGDKLEKDRLERKLERLKESKKSLQRDKKDTIEHRLEDIKRRERELEEKAKRLAKKRKSASENPSEDFQKAMERWEASLDQEREQLEREKAQVEGWGESLGVKNRDFSLDLLPFIGEGPSEIEKVREMDSKKMFKLSEEKQGLLEEKEILYKQIGEVNTLLSHAENQKRQRAAPALESSEVLQPAPVDGQTIREQQEKLARYQAGITALEAELEAKKADYEERFGRSALETVVGVPTQIVKGSTMAVVKSLDKSLSFLNPFDGDSGPEPDPDKLLEKRMHLQEKIAAQQNITRTLTEAFDAELALQEQRRLLANLHEETEVDPRELRKEIKTLEKQIRSGYEEIQDRHEHKKELLKQMDDLLTQDEETRGGALHTVTAPFVGGGKLLKSFLFGLPDEGAELTQAAESLNAGRAIKEQAIQLKEQVELESLMIEAKSKEIMNLEKELDILEAKASLKGGFKFRSSFVKIPYQFIGEAIRSAKNVIPSKDRDEIIIQKLEEETAKLEASRAELKEVDAQIARLSAPPAGTEEPVREEPAVEEKTAQAEIDLLHERLESERLRYTQEKAILEHQILQQSGTPASLPLSKEGKKQIKTLEKQEDKLKDELEEIQKELTGIIQKEAELEEKEFGILEKRISRIDEVVQEVKSKALRQDLITERDRMEKRLSQISLRQDFLSSETERFQFADTGKAN